MNSYIPVLGIAGTIIGLVRAVPQLVRVVRAREAHGVSLDSTATSSIVSFGWATYGILTNQIFVSFATGSSGLIFAVVTYFALRFGRSLKEFKVAPLWFIVLLIFGMFARKSGLGTILPISVLASNIPQLWVAYKEGNLADLSLGTWALSITDGLIWGSYSLIQHDISIMVYGFFQLISSGSIVLLKLSYNAKGKNLSTNIGN